jgi:hypothetical protein
MLTIKKVISINLKFKVFPKFAILKLKEFITGQWNIMAQSLGYSSEVNKLMGMIMKQCP